MQVKYIVIGLFLAFGCSVSAMNNRRDLIKDITDKFELDHHDSVVDVAFLNSHRVSFVAHTHPSTECASQFGEIDSDDNYGHPVVHKEISRTFSVTKITPGGNLLFGCDNGKVGFYLKNTRQGKILPTGSHSRIIAISNNVVIDGHDKKPCKVLVSVAVDGTFYCNADEEKNSQGMSLVRSFADVEHRNDHEIIAADIQPYTTSCSMLPFVAYAFRYKNVHTVPGRYRHKILVYNPINSKIVSFNGHTGPIKDIRFLPDFTVCSASNDGTIRLWDPMKQEKLYTVQCVDEPVVPCPGMLLHGMFHMLNNEDVENGPKTVSCVAPSPCGRYMASLDVSGNLCLWDVDTGKCLHQEDLGMCSCKAASSKVVFSPDSTRLCVFNPHDQKIYNVRHFVEKLKISLSDEERKNGINTFLRKQKKSMSFIAALQKREMGIKQ